MSSSLSPPSSDSKSVRFQSNFFLTKSNDPSDIMLKKINKGDSQLANYISEKLEKCRKTSQCCFYRCFEPGYESIFMYDEIECRVIQKMLQAIDIDIQFGDSIDTHEDPPYTKYRYIREILITNILSNDSPNVKEERKKTQKKKRTKRKRMSSLNSIVKDLRDLDFQKKQLQSQLRQIDKKICYKQREQNEYLSRSTGFDSMPKTPKEQAEDKCTKFFVPQSVRDSVSKRSHSGMSPQQFRVVEHDNKLYWSPIYEGSSDMFNEVYDNEGRYICAPFGGITGHGDGKCPPNWYK